MTGLAVAASPDSAFTAVWGEAQLGEGSPVPPGRVRSTDRTAGAGRRVGCAAARRRPPDRRARLRAVRLLRRRDRARRQPARRLAADRRRRRPDRPPPLRERPGGAWGAGRDGRRRRGTGGAVPFAGVTASGIPVVSVGGVPARVADRHSPRSRAAPRAWPTGPGRAARSARSREHRLPRRSRRRRRRQRADRLDEIATGVFTAGFDGAGPRFTAFSLPSGSLGAGALLGRRRRQLVAPASIAWTFGDGAGAPGRERDPCLWRRQGPSPPPPPPPTAVGNAAARSGTVTVTAEPTPTPTPDPCGTADKDKDGIKDTLRHQRRLEPPRGVQDRQREGRLRRGLRQAAGRRRARVAGQAAQGLRPADGRPDDPGRLDARHRARAASACAPRPTRASTSRPPSSSAAASSSARSASRAGRRKKRSTKLITELRLSGSSFSKACKAKASISAKKRSKKRVRRLFGDGKGTFRTRGPQRRGDRPRHALERPGPLRRDAGGGPAGSRRGPRLRQAQDRDRAHRPHVPRPAPLNPPIDWPTDGQGRQAREGR